MTHFITLILFKIIAQSMYTIFGLVFKSYCTVENP